MAALLAAQPVRRGRDRRRRGDRRRLPDRHRHRRGPGRPGRRVVAAGPACAASDALDGTRLTVARHPDLAAAGSWEQARQWVADAVTGRLAATAGVHVSFEIHSKRPAAPLPARRPVRARWPRPSRSPAPTGSVTHWPGRPLAGGRRSGRQFSVLNGRSDPVLAVRSAHADAASVLRWAGDLGIRRGDRRALRRGGSLIRASASCSRPSPGCPSAPPAPGAAVSRRHSPGILNTSPGRGSAAARAAPRCRSAAGRRRVTRRERRPGCGSLRRRGWRWRRAWPCWGWPLRTGSERVARRVTAAGLVRTGRLK